MRFVRALPIAIASVALVQPVHAQKFSDGYTFLKAVRDGDGNKVTEMLGRPGERIINTQDPSSGEGALHIVAARQDNLYLRFLLGKGANPNLRDNNGDTPAMRAVDAGFTEGLRTLARYHADFNVANNRGETPLIRAVQRHDLDMVQLLLDNGANPDQRDFIAGMSARDYAERDTRWPAIADALKKAPKKASSDVIGPSL